MRKTVKALDLAILLYHVHRGAQHNEVGFEDAQESLESLTKALNKEISIPLQNLESALWSANLLDENNEFWHPEGLTFDEWVKKAFGKYDRFYCLLKDYG